MQPPKASPTPSPPNPSGGPHGSYPPSAMPRRSPDAPPESEAMVAPVRTAWPRHLVLFLITAASVFGTYFASETVMNPEPTAVRDAAIHAGQFAGTLLSILLAHEFGHYFAARIHKVEATLPFFIPMPLLSPFGTMGAVIRMRGTIPTRRALLDIGAAGPLAGLVLAIPLYAYGLAHSKIISLDGLPEGAGGITLGSSLLLRLLERIGAPNVPYGMDIQLSPIAFAAWAGLFVTMINLLPVSQLDGGHVAYALFGPRQNKYAAIVHRAMLAFFFVSVVGYLQRDIAAGAGLARIGKHVNNSIFWLVWFEVIAVLGTFASRAQKPRAAASDAPTLSVGTRVLALLSLLVFASTARDESSLLVWGAWFVGLGLLLAMEARGGALRASNLLDHPPPTANDKLDPVRVVVAVVSLAAFAALFMPAPFVF